MILKTVRLNKKDTCFSYVLKRVGIKSKTEFAKDILKNTLTPFNIENAEVGKIVVWESSKEYSLLSTEIRTLAGKPTVIKNHEYVGLHFGVIEAIETIKDKQIITISDCIRNSNRYSHPTVDLATITLNDTVKNTEVRVPQYYLNYKKIEDNGK